MNRSEINELIARAANFKWFSEREVKFDLPYISYQNELKGVSATYSFVVDQVNGWKKSDGSLPNELQSSLRYFETIRERIEWFINTYYLEPNETQLNRMWHTHVQLNISNSSSQRPLIYELPETQYLIKIYNEHPEYFPAAYRVVIGETFNVNTPNLLIGGLLAAEFILRDSPDIRRRRISENQSIGHIRGVFRKRLAEAEQHYSEFLANGDRLFKERTEEVDKLIDEKDSSFKEWFRNITENTWNPWYEDASNNLQSLEKTYEEKLKLEKPAQYWADRAKKLRCQAWICLCILVVLVLAITIGLSIILSTAPERIFEKWFTDDIGLAVKWSIIFITLMTFVAYCIRGITRVMFSSFHLARDSEERHTLTYFYLSLIKDADVSQEDRQLIMQALFSRSDTGLIKEDSSPSMPSSTILSHISKS